MPAKMLPNRDGVAWLSHNLCRRGFRPLTGEESRNASGRLGLVPPSPRKGRELGFIFSANGLDVVVWTSFVERDGRARNQDSGWILIREGDRARYFAHPKYRTKNFLENLLEDACIARQRVLNRPRCPECGQHMHITRGGGLKSRFWMCLRPEYHRKSVRLPWDCGLPPEALKRVKQKRKKRKCSGTALRRRRPWKASRPENLVPSR